MVKMKKYILYTILVLSFMSFLVLLIVFLIVFINNSPTVEINVLNISSETRSFIEGFMTLLLPIFTLFLSIISFVAFKFIKIPLSRREILFLSSPILYFIFYGLAAMWFLSKFQL